MKRHPIRGTIAGLLVGLGINIMLIIYSAAAYQNLVPPIVLTVCMTLIGLVLGLWGPARRRPKSTAAVEAQS